MSAIQTSNPQNPTFVRIHKDTLLDNYNHFASGDVMVAPVIKANAYGHGAVKVAQLLADNTDAPFFVVATYQQAVMLREGGITKPILVIGYVSPLMINENQHPNITFTAIDLDHLQEIDVVLTKTQPIHLKLDTGMHRYGLEPDKIDEAIDFLQSVTSVVLTGVFSHLCDTFTHEVNDFTISQIETFNTLTERITQIFPSCKTVHLASTSSHDLRSRINANTDRVGIGLFGLVNFTDKFCTEPVLSLMSTIASIRTVPAGEYVGYLRTYSPQTDRKIATIPAGYYEGVDRRLSNCGVVRVSGEVCPIVGKVSMNAATIDITDCRHAPRVGDLVEIISADHSAPNSARAITETIDAVHYRITTQIPAHLERILV